jgi:hypothetical protein
MFGSLESIFKLYIFFSILILIGLTLSHFKISQLILKGFYGKVLILLNSFFLAVLVIQLLPWDNGKFLLYLLPPFVFLFYIFLALVFKNSDTSLANFSASKVNLALLIILLLNLYIWLSSWDKIAITPNQDSELHALFIGNIINKQTFEFGQIREINPLIDYTDNYYYPIGFHLLTAALKLLTGLSISTSMYLMYSLFAFVWAVGIFLLLLKNKINFYLSFCISAIALVIYEFPFKPIEWGGFPFMAAISLSPLTLLILNELRKKVDRSSVIQAILILNILLWIYAPILIFWLIFFIKPFLNLLLKIGIRKSIYISIIGFTLLYVSGIYTLLINLNHFSGFTSATFNFDFLIFENLNEKFIFIFEEVLSLKLGQSTQQFLGLNYLILFVLIISLLYTKNRIFVSFYLYTFFVAFISINPNLYSSIFRFIALPFHTATERITYLMVLPTILVIANVINGFFIKIRPFSYIFKISQLGLLFFFIYIFSFNLQYSKNKLSNFLVVGNTLSRSQYTIPEICPDLMKNDSIILNSRKTQLSWWQAEYNIKVLGTRLALESTFDSKYIYLLNNIHRLGFDNLVDKYINDYNISHVVTKGYTSPLLIASEYNVPEVDSALLNVNARLILVCGDEDLLIWKIQN